MTLFWQHFRAYFSGLLIWMGATALLTVAITRAAPAAVIDDATFSAMQALPEAIRNMLGYQEGLSALDSYIVLKFSSWAALIGGLYAPLLALSIVTREVDRRTIDFLLALPVERARVLLSRVGVMLLNSGLVVLTMWLVLRYDLAAQGLEGSWGGYALMLINTWLLVIAIGSVALLTSIWIDEYSLGVRLWLGGVTGIFFLDLAMKAAGLSRWQRVLSPFSYADGPKVLQTGEIPLIDAVVLIGVTVAAVAASVWAFQRKQIAA